MTRFFRNGKLVVAAVLAALAVPSVSALPAVLEVPALEPQDSPLPGSVETAPGLTPDWQSILVGKLVNLTLDYAGSIDPQDNATEHQRKAEAYLAAMRFEIGGGIPTGLCLHFSPGNGLMPGPGNEDPNPYYHLNIALGRWEPRQAPGADVIC